VTPPIHARDLRPGEYRALAELRYRIRRFLRFSEAAARDAGLEPQQHQLLLAVKGMPAERVASIGDVADRLQLKPNSVDELVRRVEQRGLITTKRGESDRRQVIVSLTADGEEALRELSLEHLEELRAEARSLLDGLEQLVGPPR
jgi:DNA-binding MarR family transcriptional regulator